MDGGATNDFPISAAHDGRYLQYNIFSNVFEVKIKYELPIIPIGRGAHGICCEAIGTPTEAELGFLCMKHLPQFPPKSFASMYPHINPVAIGLIERMLTFDPNKRITGTCSFEILHCIIES
ncbi:hypothetical protein ZIOFF_048970 [Zingiber officinale]|uniref:Uncharacterized protein n=1 Tax=Zingiber officinale TaxID=94328 RepID=A0A8J5FTC8_ZINOF|nr:hypothetical protein ZIOFF_048970 [Zingiber officinale]